MTVSRTLANVLGRAQAAAAIPRQHLTYMKYLEQLGAVPVQELLGQIPSPLSEWVSRSPG
jgi:hypothetical protein